jgi:hypothetical protein
LTPRASVFFSLVVTLVQILLLNHLRALFEVLIPRKLSVEKLNQTFFGLDAKSEWFPYPDKAVCSRIFSVLYNSQVGMF